MTDILLRYSFVLYAKFGFIFEQDAWHKVHSTLSLEFHISVLDPAEAFHDDVEQQA